MQTEVEAPAKKSKRVKGETYQITFNLYKQGKSIDVIAMERNLSVSTIEGHFAKLITAGLIAIEQVMEYELMERIQHAIRTNPGKSAAELLTHLNNEVSYGALRMVQAHNEKTAPTN